MFAVDREQGEPEQYWPDSTTLPTAAAGPKNRVSFIDILCRILIYWVWKNAKLVFTLGQNDKSSQVLCHARYLPKRSFLLSCKNAVCLALKTQDLATQKLVMLGRGQLTRPYDCPVTRITSLIFLTQRLIFAVDNR